jgi:hypothetical protein
MGGNQPEHKKVKVSSYSGYKGDETPRSFIIEGESVEILEVLRMWVEERHGSRERRRFFRVRGSDGYLYTLGLDEKSMEWFLTKG